MTRELTPWLEQQFPDIEFTFVVGYNSMDFYTDLDARGDLPDIITCRRFSLNDAAHLSDKLMDLSETDVAGSFYDSYIDNNRETGGEVRWLPMCAEVDGYIANADLFEKYGIDLSTNYDEFADACRKFDELGLRCYVNDYREDYSCMEALQGCAIPELMTMEGRLWREKYENETPDDQVGLDKNVWTKVFDKFGQYMKDTMIRPEDTEMSFAVGYSSFIAAPVFEGEYTRQQLNRTLANRLIFRKGELTGAELKNYMEWLINAKEDGSNPIRHKNLIPVTSGMEYTITDNGDGTYTLSEITINGAAIEDSRVYTIMTIGDDDYIESSIYCSCPIPSELNEKMAVMEDNIYSVFVSALEGGKQFDTPSEYVTVLR